MLRENVSYTYNMRSLYRMIHVYFIFERDEQSNLEYMIMTYDYNYLHDYNNL